MWAAFLKGLGLGILLAISMGPVIFAILKQSISNGRKAGYCFVGGVSVSDISVVVVSNFFTGMFQMALDHKVTIAVVGSIFLLGVGIYTFFFKKDKDTVNVAVQKDFSRKEYLGIFVGGYLINILNPGIFIFWLVWTATILADSLTELHPVQYRWIVFGTCLLFVLLTDILKVQLAGKLRSTLTPKNMHYLNQLSGLLLIGFGIGLFIKTIFFS